MESEYDLVRRAQLNLGRKDYRLAIADCTTAIRIRPDFYVAYFYRGKAKHDLGDYQGAMADLTKAIEMKPDFAEAYHARALAKTSTADYHGAVIDLTKTISLNGDDAESYFDRGVAYLGLGRKSEAIAGFERAMKLGYRIPPELLRMCQQVISPPQGNRRFI
jgi:tetratricopeptide (TPR) repeat protein